MPVELPFTRRCLAWTTIGGEDDLSNFRLHTRAAEPLSPLPVIISVYISADFVFDLSISAPQNDLLARYLCVLEPLWYPHSLQIL